MDEKSALVFTQLRSLKFNTEDEKELQRQVAKECVNVIGIENVNREYHLDDKNIIDVLLFDEIGIEIKITGNKKSIYKQCVRYCSFEKIKELVLITNRSMGFPKQINNKDCYVINIGKAWL